MSNEFHYDAFNRYFEKGIAAKNAGNIELAKSQLLLAAESLKKLADASTGELRRTRQERVLRILEAVEELENEGKNAKPGSTKFRPNNPGKKDDNVKTEESETEWVAASIPAMDFSKVAGLEEVKQAAKNMIIDPILYPDLYAKHNLKTGGGIMMYGLPGTGKTTIAKAIAGEVKGKFYNVKCSDIFSKWVGEAERNIRNLFITARKQERSVIFFDDCDAFGAGRGEGSDTTSRKVLTELLVQIDGVDSDNSNLLLLASTNAPWNMDGALIRTGRFDRFLEIPLPDDDARDFIIKRELESSQLDPDIDFAEIINKTKNYSGADLVGICNYVKGLSLNRDKEARIKGLPETSVITHEDFIIAIGKIRSSIKLSDVEKLEDFKAENNIK